MSVYFATDDTLNCEKKIKRGKLWITLSRRHSFEIPNAIYKYFIACWLIKRLVLRHKIAVELWHVVLLAVPSRLVLFWVCFVFFANYSKIKKLNFEKWNGLLILSSRVNLLKLIVRTVFCIFQISGMKWQLLFSIANEHRLEITTRPSQWKFVILFLATLDLVHFGRHIYCERPSNVRVELWPFSMHCSRFSRVGEANVFQLLVYVSNLSVSCLLLCARGHAGKLNYI